MRLTRRCLVIILGVILAVAPASTMTGMPYPPASEFTQILNRVMLSLQLEKQAQMLALQLKQWSNESLQGKIFTVMEFGQIAQGMLLLEKNIQNGAGISYTMQGLDNVFRSAYPGYVMNNASYDAQYQQWGKVNTDTIAGVLNSLHVSSISLASDTATLARIQNFAGTATGQNQVLQAGTMLANMQVGQLMNLRQLMMAQIQSEAVYQGHELNNQQVREGVQQRAFTPVNVKADN